MSNMQKMAVEITSVTTQKKSSGQIEIEYWDKKARTRRGLKIWGITWGVGLFCVMLPVIHFFAVPIALIAGPLLFTWIASQSSAVTGGRGVCPECGADLPLAGGAMRFPLTDLCAQCQHEVKIAPISLGAETTAEQST